MKNTLLVAALLLPAAAARAARPHGGCRPESPRDSLVLLRPAAVWDAIDDAPHAGWAVLVRGDRIDAVGPAGTGRNVPPARPSSISPA